MAKAREAGSGATGRAAFIACLVIALTGMGLSAELVRVHHQALDPEGPPPSCAFGEGIDCSPVALSEWGQVLGVPTAAWALVTYAGFAVLAIMGILRRVFPRGPGGLVFWGSIPCLAFGAFLAYVMAFEIGSLCVFCLGLDLVNVGLVACGGAAVWRRGARGALREDVAALLVNKPSMVAILGGPSLAAVLIWASFNNAAATEGSRGLPPLELPDAGPLVEMDRIDQTGAPALGPADAAIVIFEFSDYQCPYCRRAHDEVRAILERNPGRIRFVHFHHPLDQSCNPRIDRPFHPVACLAASAAICAEERDRFWELNDLLFENGARLDEEMIVRLAVRAGLERDEVVRCMESDHARERILEDLEEGLQVPVSGTPTFVVNGRVIPGYIGPQFEVMIRHLLANRGRWPERVDAPRQP
jgi:protein-disulfide isomerase/uncharacterized membrane protein